MVADNAEANGATIARVSQGRTGRSDRERYRDPPRG